MKVDKRINDDKTISISFCFNPEEYLMKDWQILQKAEEVIISEIISMNAPITKTITAMILKNKKAIISRAKKNALKVYMEKIEDVLEESR